MPSRFFAGSAVHAPQGQLRCKGTHAIQIRKWVEICQGPDAFMTLLAAHGWPARAWGDGLLVGGWYDAGVLLSVIEAAAQAEGISVDAAVEQIARANAREDLTTVYRAFMRVLSPVRVLALLPRLWRQYFQFGSVTIAENRPGYVDFFTSGLPVRFVPWARGGWYGFLPETIRIAGGHDPQIVHASVLSGEKGAWTVRIQAKYNEAP